MAIKKEDVRKALDALEATSPNLVKGEGAKLNPPEGAAQEGGSLKAPGTPMSDEAPKKKSGDVKKGEFPPKKDDDEDHDEDEEGEDEEDEGDGKGDKKESDNGRDAGKQMKKSAPASFRDGQPDEITTKVDVSNFLRSLVDHTAVTVDGLREALMKSDMAHDSRVESLEDRFDAVQKSLGNIGVVLGAICERMGVIENQPAAAPKSIVKSAAPRAAAPVERTFEQPENPGAGAAEAPGLYKSLNGRAPHIQKSMIADAMCDLVRKGEAQDTDVINFETYGYIPGAIDAKLRAVLN